MSNPELFAISGYIILEVVVAGIALAILLRFIHRAIPKPGYRWIKNMYPLFEIGIWVLYGFWALYALLKDSVYYLVALAAVSTIVVFWLGWFVAGDFIAGIVLRLAGRYQTGQSVMFNEVSGIIIEVNNLSLKIQMPNGVTAIIPYRNIIGTVQFKTNIEKTSSQHRFDIQVTKNKPIEDIHASIRIAILLSAGASIKHEPQIILKKSLDHTWQFEVAVTAVSPDYYPSIERNVRSIENIDNPDPLILNP